MSLVVSIETKKKLCEEDPNLILKTHNPTGSVDCVQIIFFYFLLELTIMFSASNHSLVASIETEKKVM